MKPALLRQSLTLALAAVGLMALSGCGGSSARTISTSSMTKAEFVARANAICARGRRLALRHEPAREGQAEGKALAEAIETTLLPAIGQTIEAIYAIGTPPEKKSQTEALLQALQQAVDEAKALDSPTLESVERLFEPSGRLARNVGLYSCSYG